MNSNSQCSFLFSYTNWIKQVSWKILSKMLATSTDKLTYLDAVDINLNSTKLPVAVLKI